MEKSFSPKPRPSALASGWAKRLELALGQEGEIERHSRVAASHLA